MIYEINLDLKQKSYFKLDVKQENDITIKANMYDGGTTVDVTNSTVVFNLLKGNKKIYSQSSNIKLTENSIEIDIDGAKAFNRSGLALAEITIVKDSKQTTTFDFKIDVEASIIEGKTIDEDYISKVQELVNTIDTANKKLQELNAWVAQHQDIVAIDNRLNTLDSGVSNLQNNKVSTTVFNTEIAKKRNATDNVFTSGIEAKTTTLYGKLLEDSLAWGAVSGGALSFKGKVMFNEDGYLRDKDNKKLISESTLLNKITINKEAESYSGKNEGIIELTDKIGIVFGYFDISSEGTTGSGDYVLPIVISNKIKRVIGPTNLTNMTISNKGYVVGYYNNVAKTVYSRVHDKSSGTITILFSFLAELN